MHIDKSELLEAASKSGISKTQGEELWASLTQKKPSSGKFDLSRLLYYFGAMVVIIAMGWFASIAWEKFGSGGIFAIALSYIVSFLIAGNFLWHKEGLRIPGGLFITIAVCLVPLAVYGLQWGTNDWFLMEAATIAGGALALYFYRFPFLTMPIFFALWFMSMDITPLIFHEDSWNKRLWVSIVFGLALLLIAYITDLKTEKDFAFWGYLFGMFTFWTGLSLLDSTSFAYFLCNAALVLLSVFLQRAVFLIFGSIGILLYFSALFDRYFAHSALFPIVLSLMGLIIICAGIWVHKNRHRIEALIPERVRAFRPATKREGPF